MKTTKTHGILLGLGVLGATTLLGAVQPAQAAPTERVRTTTTVRTVQYRRNTRRPIYVRPGVVRPGYNNRYNGRGVRQSQVLQTLTGRVTKDLYGNSFNMRNGNGPVVSVVMLTGEPRRISRDDQVQVSGYYRNGVFQGQSLTILRNR